MGIVGQLADAIEQEYEPVTRDAQVFVDRLLESGPRFSEMGSDPDFLINLHSVWIKKVLSNLIEPYAEQAKPETPRGDFDLLMSDFGLPHRGNFNVEREFSFNGRWPWVQVTREKCPVKEDKFLGYYIFGRDELRGRQQGSLVQKKTILAFGSGKQLFYLHKEALDTLTQSFLPAHLFNK